MIKKELQAPETNKRPFEVVGANSFESDTFVFPETEKVEIPRIVLLDFEKRTIRFATPRT